MIYLVSNYRVPSIFHYELFDSSFCNWGKRKGWNHNDHALSQYSSKIVHLGKYKWILQKKKVHNCKGKIW